MRRLLAATAILVATVAVLLLAELSGALERLDLLTLDARIALGIGRKPPSGDVVIAWIDQESIDAMAKDGFPFPWARAIYLDAIRYIAGGQPKAIVLDVLWSEPRDNAAEDTDFGKGLAAIRGDVHSFKFITYREGGLRPAEEARFAARGLPADRIAEAVAQRLAPATGFVLPVPEVEAGADALGFVNVRPDADKVFRRYDLVRVRGGKAYPSLGLAAALVARGVAQIELGADGLRLAGRLVPTTPDGRLQLAFRGGEFTFPRIKLLNIGQSAAQVELKQTPDVPQETFRDKVVIVGINAEGYEDVTATPTSALFSGPELHATAIDNLLAGDALRLVPIGWPLALLVALLAIALVWLTPSVPLALLCALALAAAVVGGAGAAFAGGLVVPLAPPLLGWACATGGAFLQRLVVEGRRRRELKRAFSSYMAPEVVAEVLADPDRVQLGGELRDVTLLFTDLKGFTSLAETMDPHELVRFLNRYFTRMCAPLLAEKGVIDKFIGDAIMALFGAPLALPKHGLCAVRAALADLQQMALINAELRASGKPEVHMRIGIHSGQAVVGNMGSESRFDYTAIGDTVNLAARLEGANKAFGTSCLVSETTWAQVGDEVFGREVGRVRVVGRAQPMVIWEPIALAAQASALDRDFVARYNAGLQALRRGDRAAASSGFLAARALRTADALVGAYLEKIEDPSFDGTFSLESK